MKYFFVVIVSTLLLVSGCQKAPVIPAPNPVETPVTLIPLPKPVVTHHILVIGDSLTEGSGEGGQGYTGWPALVWPSLKSQGVWIMPVLSGEGGSGYVHPGLRGSVFGERAASLVSPQDELVVFFGSSNDSVAPPSVLASAVRDAFAKTKAAAPAAKLLVIGPVAPNPPPEIARIPGILRDEAQAVGAVFVDPIAEGWLATNPELIGSDGVHPNAAGHQYLAERIGPLIRDALQPSGGG
jgi:lysophospholipase L1-like esterase